MIPAGWSKVDNLTITHESGRATVRLVPYEPKRWGRHFIVRVDDDWIYERTYIRPFYRLTDAVGAAVRKIASNDARR